MQLWDKEERHHTMDVIPKTLVLEILIETIGKYLDIVNSPMMIGCEFPHLSYFHVQVYLGTCYFMNKFLHDVIIFP